MTDTTERDFTQFTGAFDTPIAADADFTARMHHMLANTPTPGRSAPATVIASPARSRTVVPSVGRRSHPVTIAASVVVVLAVVLASVWVLSSTVLESDYASAPSGIATLPANAAGTPGADTVLQAELIAGTQNADLVIGVFDNVILYQAWPDHDVEVGLVRDTNTNSTAVPTAVPIETTSTLVAFDVRTGETIWELPSTSLQSTVVAGDIVMGMQFDSWSDGSTRSVSLVAIELQSGKVLWENVIKDTPEPMWSMPVAIVVDNHIVFADDNGTIAAWDSETGALIWENEFDPGEGYDVDFIISGGESKPVTRHDIASTTWNGHIVIINGDGLLQVLDAENGNTVATHTLLEMVEGTYAINQLQVLSLPDGVLIVRDFASPDGQRSKIMAVDPHTGDIHWTNEFDGNLAVSVSDDGSIAMLFAEWQQHTWFMRLLGQSGYTTSQFLWLDGQTGKEILRTDRGKTEFPLFALTDGTYACTRIAREQMACFDRTGTRYLLDNESYLYPVLADGVLYVPSPDGLYRVDLP